jgi:molybdopterin converting factor small subunit
MSESGEITVKLLFFSAAAEAAGCRETQIRLQKGSKVSDAVDIAEVKFPELKKLKLFFALNESYVEVVKKVKDGDCVAIFTAVSGG